MVASVSVLVYVLQIMAEGVLKGRDCPRRVLGGCLRADQLVPEATPTCVNARHRADAGELTDSDLQVEAFRAFLLGNGTSMVSSVQCD